MEELLLFLGLLALGYFAGQHFERQHYKSLYDREEATCGVMLTNLSVSQGVPEAQEAAMFVGNVVIATDYFKTFIAGIMNLFGGRLTVYETLLERGRREALLRMKEAAIAWGAVQIVNVRLETASLNDESGAMPTIEVIAYGTGIC